MYKHRHTTVNIILPFCNESSSSHLGQPIVVRSTGPVFRIIFVCQREYGDLVSFAVQFLYECIIAVLVWHEESSFDGTTVGVHSVWQRVIENFFVQIHVVNIYSTVECNSDQLRYLYYKLQLCQTFIKIQFVILNLVVYFVSVCFSNYNLYLIHNDIKSIHA